MSSCSLWTRAHPRQDEPQQTMQTQELMVQALTDVSFTEVCVDSGAGESVCPVEAFPSYETKTIQKIGVTYTAAGGQPLVNVGGKKPRFKTNGIDATMTFQATTMIKKPLAAASKIAEKGNRVILDDIVSESYIENKKTGTRIPLKLKNGVYMMEMQVKQPFQRPAQK